MFNILPPLLIILGLAGLVFIFKRQNDQRDQKIVTEIIEEKITNREKEFLGRFLKVFNRRNYQKTSNQFFLFVEKFLVRSRIIILRVDGAIFKNLAKIRGRKNNGGEQEKKNGIIQSFSEEKSTENDADTLHILNISREEKELLKKIENNPEDITLLKNLARLYLWQEDFSSARWALLQAYRLNKEDNVVLDLLVELYEKIGRK